jgi:hypothetical protein
MQYWRLAAVILVLILLPPPARSSAAQDDGFVSLFDGQRFEHLYRFLPSTGRDQDPLQVFKIEDAILHLLDVPETDQPQDFGYLATVRDFSNYHFRVRYRWGHKRFAPRAQDKRDAGILYHVVGPDLIWPRSVESQIQEGDTGDIFLVSGTGASTTIDPRFGDPQYLEGGAPYTQIDGRIIKSTTVDSLSDWNLSEVIVTGSESVHIVNGTVVARMGSMTQPDPADPGAQVPLDRGRILLQAEGAEVFYDGIEIKEFADLGVAMPTGAVLLWDDLTVCPGCGDQLSAGRFQDFRLHLEFLVPPTSPTLSEQERGNSGIYLQGRYEVQVLDSFGAVLADQNDAAAVYALKDADSNAARPSGTWQSYDVDFQAARFGPDGSKVANARLSLSWNGTQVHNDIELPGPTPGGQPESPEPGPIQLQDHGNPVRYRNVWLLPR